MPAYEVPAIVATVKVTDLINDAAVCFSYISDRRFKEDIRPVDGALAKLGQIGKD